MERAGEAAGLSALLLHLNDIGLSYNQDRFLLDTVEIAVLRTLRDLKYKARVQIFDGYKLLGVMDETGFLKEGEIFVCTEKVNGPSTVRTADMVAISRSPALHPGDVQVVRAVEVPEDSPLRRLSNCVVFSQHGERDLASCLSGGDLDGDLYDVIFDQRFIPEAIHTPADYPRAAEMQLDHAVTKDDITEFFINFMKNDRLGAICNRHMQLADQRDRGTKHHDCIQLAGMASTAVDFSKTGTPVDMKDAPRANMSFPDFMADGPQLVINEKGASFEEQTFDFDDDEDDPVADLDPDLRKRMYYESSNVLGLLYRNIDEFQFFKDMQEAGRHGLESAGLEPLMSRLWEYVERETQALQWEQYKEVAKEVKETYEHNLLATIRAHSPSTERILTELEVFSGSIVGNSRGAQGKQVRELAKSMRDKYERDTRFAIERIVHDEDGDRNEALPRAVASLWVGMNETGLGTRDVGEMKSFKYVAAGVCLRELKAFHGGLLQRL